MANRRNLQDFLEELIESRNVYFNPPESVKMKYPAIRYSLTDLKKEFADNIAYKQYAVYELTLIDKDPDSKFLNLITTLMYCDFVRFYAIDGLNHWVFNLCY